MSLNNISRLLQQSGGGAQPNADSPQVDTAEQIYISSLALIKMLKHGANRCPQRQKSFIMPDSDQWVHNIATLFPMRHDERCCRMLVP
jgi:26S proteasome regulatory subunit N11